MNTMVRDTGIEMALPLHDASAPDQEPRRRRVRWSAAGPVGIVLLSGVTLFVLGQRAVAPEARATLPAYEAAAPAPAGGIATMPSAPVDGVLQMVIPPGAAADQQAGGRGYVMPSRIDLEVGDRIVIRNDDDAPHMVLYTFLEPGETHERTFTEPGSEVYSSGCGLHAAAILNFTSIFVSEPGASGAAA